MAIKFFVADSNTTLVKVKSKNAYVGLPYTNSNTTLVKVK